MNTITEWKGNKKINTVFLHDDGAYKKFLKKSPLLIHDPASIIVSEEGDNWNGDGTVQHPYRTISKALSMIDENRKRIIVLPGNYVEYYKGES